MIQRRAWLQMIIGVVTLSIVRVRPPVYLYDWAEGTTTDPKGLRYGPGCCVTINGKDVSHLKIRRCQTGPDGFVDYLRMIDDQIVINHTKGVAVEDRIEGHVRFFYKKVD